MKGGDRADNDDKISGENLRQGDHDNGHDSGDGGVKEKSMIVKVKMTAARKERERAVDAWILWMRGCGGSGSSCGVCTTMMKEVGGVDDEGEEVEALAQIWWISSNQSDAMKLRRRSLL